jgi:hypothetical protein
MSPPATCSPKPSSGCSDFGFWPNGLSPRAPLDHALPPPQIHFAPPTVGPLHPQTSPPAFRSLKRAPAALILAFGSNPAPPPRAPLDCTPLPPQIHFTPHQVGPLYPTVSPPATCSPKPSSGGSDFGFWPNGLPPRAPLDHALPPPQIDFTPPTVGSLHPKTSLPAFRSPKRAPAARIWAFGSNPPPPSCAARSHTPTTSNRLYVTHSWSPPSKNEPPPLRVHRNRAPAARFLDSGPTASPLTRRSITHSHHLKFTLPHPQ